MNCPWSNFSPEPIYFCERLLCAWVKQPADAWSNAGFVFGGVIIALLAFKRKQTALLSLAALSFFAGIGSFALHATATYWGAIIDLISMNFVVIFALIFELKRLWKWKEEKVATVFIILNCLAVIFMLVFRSWNLVPFVGAFLMAALIEWRLRHAKVGRKLFWPLKMVFATFLVALFLWILDSTHLVCDPDNHFFQLHAVWHILNAVALVFLYFHFAQFVKPAKLR